MRFALVVLLLALPTAGAWGLSRDEAGDVDLPSADVRFVGVSRAGDVARVTVGYGAALPTDLDLRLVFQLGSAPEQVAVMSVWRTPAEPEPEATFAFYDPVLAMAPAEGAEVRFGEDAVQFVVPAETVDPHPCFLLRSLRSVHTAEDGARYADALDPVVECVAPASISTPAPPAEESAFALPEEAHVPTPSPALVMGLLALVALTRRR